MPLAETLSNRVLLSYWAFEVPGSFQQIKGKTLMQNVSFLSSSSFNQQRRKDEKLLSCGVGIKPGALFMPGKHCPSLATVCKREIYFACVSAGLLSSPHGLALAHAFDHGTCSFFLLLLLGTSSFPCSQASGLWLYQSFCTFLPGCF